MLIQFKKAFVTCATALLIFGIGIGNVSVQPSYAQSSFDIAARITQLTGLAEAEIEEIYAVEQRADIVLVHFEVVIPIVLEPKIGYLLIKTTAGLWIRQIVESTEWRNDFVPELEALGVEILQQPPGTIDSVTPAAEAAQLALVSAASGADIADVILSGLPVDGVPSAPSPAAASDPGTSVVSDELGTTEGVFRVDESGAATYIVRISAAAGTAGVAPQISLNYSSASRNGVAGMGWSIGGLSAVSRCRQTREQDHEVTAITWTAEDRFCLDGQRLLLESGASYGAPGSTYRTEIESGAVVEAVGSVNGEPNYFVVRREDGSVSSYGRTADDSDESAKLKGGSSTLTWGIRRFEDSAGNPIWFEYETGSSALRISNIRYAYGSNPGPGAQNARIEFVYEGRADVVSGYVAGYLFSNDRRLTNVRSYNRISGTEHLIRDYVLRYGENQASTPDVVSRLTSIEECLNGVCLPKTEFSWNLPTNATTMASLGTLSLGGNYSGLTPADINGDSKMDLVWFVGTGSTKQLRYAESTGSGFTNKTFSSGATTLSLPVGATPKRLQAIDYNLDGRQDIAYFDDAAREWKVLRSEPFGEGGWRLNSTPIATGLAPALAAKTDVTFVDMNSDGAVDALYQEGFDNVVLRVRLLERDPGEPATSPTAYRFGQEITVSNYLYADLVPVAPDFNGDGQVDLLVTGVDMACDDIVGIHDCSAVWNTTLSLTLNLDSAGQASTSSYYNFPWAGGYPELLKARIADVNADGLSDVLYPIANTYMLRINRGDGSFDQQILTDSSLNQQSASPVFAD